MSQNIYFFLGVAFVRYFVIAMRNVVKYKVFHSLATDSRKGQLVIQSQECTTDLWLRWEVEGSLIEPVTISRGPEVNRQVIRKSHQRRHVSSVHLSDHDLLLW